MEKTFINVPVIFNDRSKLEVELPLDVSPSDIPYYIKVENEDKNYVLVFVYPESNEKKISPKDLHAKDGYHISIGKHSGKIYDLTLTKSTDKNEILDKVRTYRKNKDFRIFYNLKHGYDIIKKIFGSLNQMYAKIDSPLLNKI